MMQRFIGGYLCTTNNRKTTEPRFLQTLSEKHKPKYLQSTLTVHLAG